MVNQSDLPFRLLVKRYGATATYTQMLVPDRLLNDVEYREFHQRDLQMASVDEIGRKVIVQLCGDDPDIIVRAGRLLQTQCDGIDLNLGCPQVAARDGHYGAYLLGQKDWSLDVNIVSAMTSSFDVPVSVKLRLCQPFKQTSVLAQRLEAHGAAWVTLHARTVSAMRRRQGPARLEEVARLKGVLSIPVVSNGNVRTWDDIPRNLLDTGADGVMVGETLLGNPCLFSNILPDPVSISLEYLDLSREFLGTVTTLRTVQAHVRHFVDFQCARRPWFSNFRAALIACGDVNAIERLLCTKTEEVSDDEAPAAAGDNRDDRDYGLGMLSL
ncbi:t-diRNAhydrouridine synthase [Fistulina hepatica ATCC 64428]|uniref:tRNA-dihydrouridine synthase n=1 Tax=Fistulina hepatica ATCC 64428 TaxID=1128425 RepID=A0A0D7ANY4_9AGAR|nr:t-diRNAhydrouridine synthase [Fistulina hepatica ATCC 64428]